MTPSKALMRGVTFFLLATTGYSLTAFAVPNLEFIVMPSGVGERARGAGFSSGRLGIIRAMSGIEGARHRPGIVLFFDLRTPFFREPSPSWPDPLRHSRELSECSRGRATKL